ncbi:uncharacterized protein LOC108095361 [Drosophila ficusphila]|uniref:uncharacterized protein LOC108095361 n=1 Tax=Drosophila ficusphila TaxID=30025 RepID=UPI0007E77E25|nr:uncharacterized protein LOC108095361 [Drosophila ficusphila]
MGRSQVRRKPHSLRSLTNQQNQEEYFLTPEEAQRSSQEWSYIWKKLPYSESVVRKNQLKDLSAYGDWHLPNGKFDFQKTGREMLMNLSKVPYPNMFHPPVALDVRGDSYLRLSGRPYVTFPIFESAMPEIYARAKEFMEPPESEGAVGYDLWYYETPFLIKRRYTLKFPFASSNFCGDSWMDGHRCAKLYVELNNPLVDYEKLRRCSWVKKSPDGWKKILAGLRKKSVSQRSTRWLRPRAVIIQNSETEEVEDLWENYKEDQTSGDYFVEYTNEEVEVETDASSPSSFAGDVNPKVTRSLSDINQGYSETQQITRRSHSLSRL